MRYWTSGTALLVLVACACATDRAAAPTLELGTAVETPHVAWANPLEGGPIHVLFMAPRYTLRDAAELAQRLEITFDAVPIDARPPLPSGGDVQHSNETGDNGIGRLQEALRTPHDVIIAGNLDLNVLPVDVQSEIFRQVSSGTGLILANHGPAQGVVYETFAEALTNVEDIASIVRGIAADITPEWYGNTNLVRASTYGDGRVLQFNYREDKPLTHCLIPALANPLHAVPEFLDSYFSLVARAVLWAAKRDADLWVEQVESVVPSGPPEEEIPPDLPPEFIQTMRDSVQQTPIRTFHIRFNRATDRDYKVTVQLREPNRGLRVVYRELPAFKKGESVYPVEVLAGPGRYLLDIWVQGKHGTVLWHTEAVNIEGWPSFSDLRLAKEVLLPHDSLDLTADIRTWYGDARPVTLYLRGVDSLGRVVTETYRECPEGGGPVDARMNFADLIARDARVEAYAVPGPPHPVDDWELNMAACEVRLLPVRHMRARTDPAVIVDAPAAYEYNARHYLQVLRDAGIDGAWTDSGEPAYRHLSRLNLRAIASVGGPNDMDPAGDPPFAWADSDFARAEAQRLQDTARHLAIDGVLDYSLDGFASPAGTGPEQALETSGLPAFRTWLQHKYKSLDELNIAWGTSLVSWDEVPTASPSGASSADLRRFEASGFAAFLNSMREHVRAVDRYARVGAQISRLDADSSVYGLDALANGLDWIAVSPDEPRLSKLVTYSREKADLLLDLRQGTLSSPELARWLPWKAVATGCTGIWLPPPYESISTSDTAPLYPDGRLAPVFQEFINSCQQLQDGLAALLRTASPNRPTVAIYDAAPIAHTDVADEANESQKSILTALARLGYGFDFLAADNVAANRLLEYGLLVLPAARALDDRAIVAIREFLNHGGHVLADIMPGSHDGLGRPRSEAVLAPVFGVQPNAQNSGAGPAPLHVVIPGESIKAEADIASVTLDATLATSGGTPLAVSDGTPAWIVHGDAPGSCLLLNHAFPRTDSPEDHAAFCRLLSAWLSQTGLKPMLDFECASGETFDGEFHRWTLGEAEFYLLLRDPYDGPSEQSLRLNLDNGGHVFDLSSRLPVTADRRPRVRLLSGEARLLGTIPYELTALEMAVPKNVVQGERLPVSISLRSKGSTCGTHLVSLTLKTVRGDELKHYRRSIVCEKGAGQTFIPMALNELPGHYVLESRELITGLASSAYVQVFQRVM